MKRREGKGGGVEPLLLLFIACSQIMSSPKIHPVVTGQTPITEVFEWKKVALLESRINNCC